MAKKDRNKRAARKARQAERAAIEAQQAQSVQAADASDSKKPVKASKDDKPAKAKKSKNGIVAKTKNYFGDVRSEMRRVVWPSKKDLKNFTIAVIAMLIVFGVVIWLLDTGVVAALVGYSGLRG